jgi:hypothetical protein
LAINKFGALLKKDERIQIGDIVKCYHFGKFNYGIIIEKTNYLEGLSLFEVFLSNNQTVSKTPFDLEEVSHDFQSIKKSA